MKILVIPDTQLRPGDSLDFLHHIGRYIVDKRPDCVVCLGDFADMASLSSYDVGKKSFEGKRYTKDIAITKVAMEVLLDPINEYNKQAKANKQKLYKPRKVMLLGNHENRINKVVESDAKLEGVLKIEDLGYKEFGWEVYPFLEVVLIGGVAFSHYFTSGMLGRPCASAAAQLSKKHMSCVQGHNQKMEIYNEYKADGTLITGLFAGCCYMHDEDYLGPQGNNYFRGIHMLYDVKEGGFHCHSITLDYLLKRNAKRKRDNGAMV